ncbi:MAG: hypothetical protein ACTSXD_05075 [Candidatus Heimdallarchaeaceae archaeon]
MVAENLYMQLSGTAFSDSVLAGSQAVVVCVMCGMSGTQLFPIMVNSSGLLITGSQGM